MADNSMWTRIKKNFPLPDAVREVIARLNDAGYLAYVVGGSVRDFLLGRETKDHDIATNAPPDALTKIFPEAVQVGIAFGVVKVPFSANSDDMIEVATFRKDLPYKDFRRPEGIELSGPEEDAKRRDFTVNALYYDPKTQNLLDVVGGISDLGQKILRAIGDPLERFQEDALRLVRAVRLATALGFEIHADTSRAIHTRAALLKKIRVERVCDEFNKIVTGPRPDRALELLVNHNLLDLVLPELAALRGIKQSPASEHEGDIWSHTLKMMRNLDHLYPKRSQALAWAVLLHDIGKPVALRKNNSENFNGHEVEAVPMARRICARLRMSHADIDLISTLIGEQLKFREVFQMREATLQRWLRQPYFEELLRFHRIDALASDGNLAFYEFCESRLNEIRHCPELKHLIDGNDLIQLGFEPGPEFSNILKSVEDLALEGILVSKEQALEWVVLHFVK